MKRLMLILVMILYLVSMSGLAEEETASTLYPIRENGIWGYMNRQGETVIEPQWDEAELFEEGYATVSTCIGDHEEMVFIIDQEGRSILDPAWEYLSGDVFIDPKTDLCGYFDRKSGFLQEPAYESLSPYCGTDAEFIIAARYSGTYEEAEQYTYESLLRYGAIRKSDGKIIVPLEYTGGDYGDIGSSEGYILLANDIHGRTSDTAYGLKYHLFDQYGYEISFPDGIEPCSLPHEGVLTIRRKLGESEKVLHPSGWGQVFGLAKPDGTIIVEPCYDYVFEANDGMVCFYQDHLNGWMNLSGEVKVPPVCHLGGSLPQAFYENGYLVINDTDTQRCILFDRNGRELYSVPTEENGMIRNISWVMSNQCFWLSITMNGTTRYQLMKIEDGCVVQVTGPDFDRIGYSCSPESVLWSNETELSDEAIPAGIGQKCGFIDSDGAVIIPFEYDAVMYFYHGLALVEKDGKLMYIDPNGVVVWEER